MTTSSPDPLADSRMSLVGHLTELRRRVVYVGVVVLVLTFGCFAFAEKLFSILHQPLARVTTDKLVVLSPLEMFFTYMKLSLVAALFLSTPWILAQLWLFVAPGLYAHEKKWIAPFIILGSVFFCGGGLFAFYVVIPTMLQYLTTFIPPTVQNAYSVEVYFNLVLHFLLAFGIVFELPLLMWILAVAGIVHPDTFAKYRRYWIIASFVLGALMSDPSPITQLLVALPLIIFWELGIIGGRLLRRRRESASQAGSAA